MQASHFFYYLLFVIISLMAGGLLKTLLKKGPLPYTVALFLFGLISGLIVRMGGFDSLPIAKNALESVAHMNPDTILYLFLPVLIFQGAYDLDVHIFQKNLINATLLAVPGMIISMILIALVLMGLHSFVSPYANWTWTVALMFGALISATDPVAVVSLLHELNTSKRFSTLVDAESMLNDGTGVVLFMLFFSTLTGIVSQTSPYFDFLQVVTLSIAVGFIGAWLCFLFVRRVKDDMQIQTTTIIVGAYLVFFLAQGVLEASGVIALVCFGLYSSYNGKLHLKPEVHRFVGRFWELAAHIGNTLIFIIVGIVIALLVDFRWSSFFVLIALYLGTILVRGLMIGILYPFMKRFGYGLSLRESAILTWGGLRGALGLTLALMVNSTPSIPEDIRHQVLFLTAGIVTLTLLINATTIGWLLDKLKLTEIPATRYLLAISSRRHLQQELNTYYNLLKKRPALQGADWEAVKRYIPNSHVAELPIVNNVDLMCDIRVRIVRQQKLYLWKIYPKGVIDARSLTKLEAYADEIFDADGKKPLTEESELFQVLLNQGTRLLGFKAPQWYRPIHDRFFPAQTVKRYDLTRGFLLMQHAALDLLEGYSSSRIFNAKEKTILASIREEIRYNRAHANAYMARLEHRHPASFKRAITHRAITMMKGRLAAITKDLDKTGF